MVSNHTSARLLYLAHELRAPLPASLIKFIPQGEVVNAIASFGIAGVEAGMKLSRPQIQELLKAGAKDGKATRDEWKYIISNLVTDSLIEQKDTMKLSEFMAKTDLLSKYINGGASIIATEEGGFSADGENIEKWDLGFGPFDSIFEGFYQGLFVILGSTGTGKTSHMLSLVEQLKKNKLCSEVWFFQTEIPRRMFEYRLKPILGRGAKFVKGKDRIFYGQQSLPEIIEMVKANPDPNRVIFHDSPDVLASSAEEGRRFELESLYRDLVILKALCKAVFVGSQVRRKDKAVKITSAAESWAKAWYADGMIGIQKLGFKGTNALMKAVVVKNRFGPAEFEITYEYSMTQLTGTLTPKSKPRAAGWQDDEDGGDDDW